MNNLRKQFHSCKGQEVQNVSWLHARLHNLKGALCTSVGLDKHCVCLHYNNKSLQYHQYPWKLPNLVNFGFLAHTVNLFQICLFWHDTEAWWGCKPKSIHLPGVFFTRPVWKRHEVCMISSLLTLSGLGASTSEASMCLHTSITVRTEDIKLLM